MKAILAVLALVSSATTVLALGAPAAAQSINGPTYGRPVYRFTPTQSGVPYEVYAPRPSVNPGFRSPSPRQGRYPASGYAPDSGNPYGW
ncbi:MAG: hypothetical protein ACKOXO_06880 [Cyanobium sp.]